jgi:dTDP-D-glucose 4,6-dehydratase
MDKLDYCATINNLASIADLPNFKFVKGDIQSFDLVAHILESEDIDTVMHFAAQVWSLHRSPTTQTCTYICMGYQ